MPFAPNRALLFLTRLAQALQYPRTDRIRFHSGPMRDLAGSDFARLEPLDIFNSPALVTDEMVMAFNVRLKPRGISAEFHFTNQTGPHQNMETVVNRGA